MRPSSVGVRLDLFLLSMQLMSLLGTLCYRKLASHSHSLTKRILALLLSLVPAWKFFPPIQTHQSQHAASQFGSPSPNDRKVKCGHRKAPRALGGISMRVVQMLAALPSMLAASDELACKLDEPTSMMQMKPNLHC